MQDVAKVLIPIAVAHVCVLAILILVIKKLLLSDTLEAVKRIQAVEAEVRRKEESIRLEIQQHEKEFTRQKAEAEEELQRHKAQSEKEVMRLRDQMLSDARKEGDRIVGQAHKNEEKLRQKIVLEMDQKAVSFGGEIFQIVFGERVRAEVNRQFIEELMDALKEIDDGSISVDVGDGEVTCSEAMDTEQKRRLEQTLSAKFGRAVTLSEKTDADLMAGLILKVGSLEIDGSLRNRYNEAVAEISKNTSA